METRICTSSLCSGNEIKKNKAEAPWSNWSQCSVSCGIGIRTRKRECTPPNSCEGPIFIKEFCEMPNCDSSIDWNSWSDWSNCNLDNQQYRKRQCLVHSNNGACQGVYQEVRQCSSNGTSNKFQNIIFKFNVSHKANSFS